MAVPTVFLVGVEHLPLVPEYLNLGSVVVMAPDQETLKRWTWERDEHLNRKPPKSCRGA